MIALLLLMNNQCAERAVDALLNLFVLLLLPFTLLMLEFACCYVKLFYSIICCYCLRKHTFVVFLLEVKPHYVIKSIFLIIMSHWENRKKKSFIFYICNFIFYICQTSRMLFNRNAMKKNRLYLQKANINKLVCKACALLSTDKQN